MVPSADATRLGSNARDVVAFLQSHGAAFCDEIVEGTRLMRLYVEEGLAELVTTGLVTADSFSGLRALMPAARGARRNVQMENAGRWAFVNRAPDPPTATDAVEHIARVLLARYGVVFWRMLEREAAWLPSWRDLLGVYRRLEARGEIRGGRFVAGPSGEQFALPDAIAELRDVRRKTAEGTLVSVSGADPMNLLGILTPGAKLPALASNRLLFCDGLPVATLIGRQVTYLNDESDGRQWELHKVLLRNPLNRRIASCSI
jgi:ATP-dependent Lhr-like helicase